jgi:DNA modification methylase
MLCQHIVCFWKAAGTAVFAKDVTAHIIYLLPLLRPLTIDRMVDTVPRAYQPPLLSLPQVDTATEESSGTFTKNMALPIHRWFRYSAGFSADWVEGLLQEQVAKPSLTVLDPFAGSGTTLIVSDKAQVRSIGIEAHPFVAKIARAKLLWYSSTSAFLERANGLLDLARGLDKRDLDYPTLVYKCFALEALQKLDRLRRAWKQRDDGSHLSELVWLALTSILRPAATAGTAQWQYILPNKSKKVTVEPYEAFQAQVDLMLEDMLHYQSLSSASLAQLFIGDARSCPDVDTDCVDLVITSPPYANNYDYADATRFEMTFWKEVESWGDLHDKVRKHLVRSSSQHTSKDKLILEEILDTSLLGPILPEITEVCNRLSEERLLHGGKKHYHTMIAAYFHDMAQTWHELRRVCKQGSTVCFVIGDSAPYGVYVPVEKWMGELAVAAGFVSFHFEKLRDRNVKWKNRKHRVPLHEGRLWVKG